MFVTRSGQQSSWGYANGASWLDGRPQVRTGQKHESAKLRLAPVAILQGTRTASSGEAIALAFRGRARTRSFGQPTAGLSTANTSFPLPDGAILVITTGVMADRKGSPYGGTVNPDELIEPAKTDIGSDQSDPVLERAIIWIESLGRCKE
jgi:C-terminal processing protease CtpA/Prc